MKHSTGFFRTAALLAALALAGCGPQGGEQAPPVATGAPAGTPVADAAEAVDEAASALPAPSWAEAANAAYFGVFEGAVALTDGQWTGEPYVEGGAAAPRAGLAEEFLLTGDLDGDGAEESAVLLWSSGGGSGTFDYVAVLDRNAGAAVSNIATAPLGDRVKVRSGAIEDGRIVFEVVQAGPGDAACCPGQKMRRTFVLEGGAMKEISAEDQGRLSLADVAGEWRLLRLGPDETVPADVQITVQFDNGTIAGNAACNRYTGSVQEGAVPGAIALAGPLATTRRMCPPLLMDWEQRYLAALEGLAQYTFIAGRLVLTWQRDDSVGQLVFVRAEVGEAASG
jgi:heat shock protein HslJ